MNLNYCYNPEESITYWKFDINTKVKFEEVPATFKENQKKLHHKMSFFKGGILTHTKGSTYMEYGNTKVIVSVNPLREKVQYTLRPKVVFPVFVTKYAGFATTDDIAEKSRTLEVALRKAIQPSILLAHYANLKIQIVVYVLEDDGCALSTAINCCSFTLTENGIAVLGIVAASTVLSYNKQFFYNPTAMQENFVKKFLGEDDNASDFGITVVASIPSLNQVSESYHIGFTNNETFDMMVTKGLSLNKCLLDIVKSYLLENV